MATFSISAVARKAQATANGSTTQFAFSFSVNTEADVAVFVGTTQKTISTHYTVSITSSTGAGSITFTSGNTPTNGQIVTIMSKTALARSSVYTSGGTINATSLETDFDTNMMLFQQQDERLDRVITAPVDDATSIDMTLPNKDARKGKVLGFNSSSGNPEATSQVTGAAVNVSTVSAGGSATASVAVSGGTATFALGIPTGATGATGATGQAGGGLANIISDTTPQLGGNLDMNGKDIVTTSNATLDLAPHGTGTVVVRGNTNSGAIVFNCESNSHGQTVKAQPHSASVTNTLTLPAGGDQTLVGTAGATFTGDVTVPDGDLILGSTAVTSTAAEINLLDGVSGLVQADFTKLAAIDSSATEMNQLDAITRGSILYGNASGATARLAKGSANTVLTSDGTDIAWQAAAGGGGAMEFIVSTGAISNAANVSFTQFDSSKYDAYAFYYYYVIPATDNVYFVWNSSTDGGSSYATSNGDYRYGQSGAGNGVGYGYVNASYSVGSDTNEFGVTGAINLMQPHNTTTYKIFQSSSGPTYSKTNGYMATDTNDYGNSYRFSTADIDAIRFKFTSGNIESGEIVMYGIKNA